MNNTITEILYNVNLLSSNIEDEVNLYKPG